VGHKCTIDEDHRPEDGLDCSTASLSVGAAGNAIALMGLKYQDLLQFHSEARTRCCRGSETPAPRGQFQASIRVIACLGPGDQPVAGKEMAIRLHRIAEAVKVSYF